MHSIGDDLRRGTVVRVLQLPIAARIELALALGDEDLDLFARASGLDREEALRRIRAQRSRGRVASVTAVVDRG